MEIAIRQLGLHGELRADRRCLVAFSQLREQLVWLQEAKRFPFSSNDEILLEPRKCLRHRCKRDATTSCFDEALNIGDTSECWPHHKGSRDKRRDTAVRKTEGIASAKTVRSSRTNDEPLVWNLNDAIATKVDRADPELLDLIEARRGEVRNNDERKAAASVEGVALRMLSCSSQSLRARPSLDLCNKPIPLSTPAHVVDHVAFPGGYPGPNEAQWTQFERISFKQIEDFPLGRHFPVSANFFHWKIAPAGKFFQLCRLSVARKSKNQEILSVENDFIMRLQIDTPTTRSC